MNDIIFIAIYIHLTYTVKCFQVEVLAQLWVEVEAGSA